VKSGNPNAFASARGKLVNALTHFVGGFICEGYSKYLPGSYAFLQKVGYAISYNACFAGACARKNYQGVFSANNRFALGWI
jgi:hypothetical protein